MMAEACDARASDPQGMVDPVPWSDARLATGAVIAAVVPCLVWSIEPGRDGWPWSASTYTPLLVYGTVLCNLAVAWRLMALLGWTPRPAGPGGHGPPVPRLSWLDARIMLVLAMLSLLILEAVRRTVNPEWACVGCDQYDYLQSIVAVESGRWDLYHAQRWLPYSLVSHLVGRALDVPYHVAAQCVSEACTLLLSPLTYCAALPLLGRRGAVLSSVLVMAFPHLHSLSLTTTSYPMFYLLFLLAVTAGVWAVVGGRTLAYGALGLSAAACLATQQQSLYNLPPLLLVALLRTLHLPLRSAALRWLAVSVPIAAYLAITPCLPVRYTPLSALIVVQRCHLHGMMPYSWPAPLTPDLTSPSPLSPWLPPFLKGGEVEALASALLAPAHSPVIAFRGEPVRLEIVPNSTIPPLSHRLRANLAFICNFEQVRDTWDAYWLLVVMGGIAFVGLLPRGASPRRWGVALILLSLLPLASQVVVLFQLRWALWSVPLLAILMANAIQVMGDLCLGPASRPWSIMRQGLVAWMALSLALTLLSGKREVWLSPDFRWASVTEALAVQPHDVHVPQGLAELRAAQWIRANAPPDATIYDATGTVCFLLSHDRRFVGRAPDFHRLCRDLVAAPPPRGPTLLVAGSGFPWKASAPHAREAFARRDLWTPLYAIRWKPQRECDVEKMSALPDATLVIFGSTARAGEPASPPP